MTESTQNYQKTLLDLKKRQRELKEELRLLEPVIAGLEALLARDASLLNQIPQSQPRPTASARYEGLSVRWGVLQYLAEDAKEPASTIEVANALLAGGMTTTGRDFTSNVSAVISVMVNKRGELEAIDGRYRLTETGYASWKAIQGTQQYRSRTMLFSSNVQ